MSNISLTLSVFGVGALLVGGYETFKACRAAEGPEKEKLKYYAFTSLATGFVFLAFAAGISTFQSVAVNAAEVPPSCPLDKLNKILDENPKTKQFFDVVKNSEHGISCANYLPWDDKFMGPTNKIDRLKATVMSKPVEWTISKFDCPVIAVQYACDHVGEEAAAHLDVLGVGAGTIYQAAPGSMNTNGFSWNAPGTCSIAYLDEFKPFKELIEKGSVVIKTYGGLRNAILGHRYVYLGDKPLG